MFKAALISGLLMATLVAAVVGGPFSKGQEAEATDFVFDIGVEGPPFVWAPDNASVPIGWTVKWTVTGTAPHTVTSEGCFDSRIGECTFDTGADRDDFLRADSDRSSFEFTFTEPGVYPFYCRLHGTPGGGGQFGVITVYEPGSAPPSGNRSASPELLATIEGEKVVEEPVITPPATGDGGIRSLETAGGGGLGMTTLLLIVASASTVWLAITMSARHAGRS